VSNASQSEIGTIVTMWRYPVKSMGGEKLSVAQVWSDGLVGDRSYAILDPSDGKVATAKNPRKWPILFAFNATCVETEPRRPHETVSPVRITLPDGTIVTTEQADLNQGNVGVYATVVRGGTIRDGDQVRLKA